MAQVIVTIKLMPENAETDLKHLENEANVKIQMFGGRIGKVEEEPIAFGLRALKIIFIMDESKGSTQPLEDELAKIKGVINVDVMEVRRALG